MSFAQQTISPKLLCLVAGLAYLASISPAAAHKPSYADGKNGSLVDAHVVENIDISMVLYKENTCASNQTWLTFTTTSAQAQLFVQLGVPQIDRLSDRRPSIAVLAPGLPAPAESGLKLPFSLPAGLGARVFETTGVEDGREFFELFTGTKSWILHESHVMLPESGTGFVVAWFPDEIAGKLWVAIGETEDFSEDDFEMASYWIEKTQAFHEEDFERRSEDQLCISDEGPGGCSTHPSNSKHALSLSLLFIVFLVSLRTNPATNSSSI